MNMTSHLLQKVFTPSEATPLIKTSMLALGT